MRWGQNPDCRKDELEAVGGSVWDALEMQTMHIFKNEPEEFSVALVIPSSREI